MASTLTALRRRIDALPKGRRRRYSISLRRDVFAFIEGRATHTTDARAWAHKLGLDWRTVERWGYEHGQHEESQDAVSALLPVVVTSTPHPLAQPLLPELPSQELSMTTAALSCLTLSAPGGYRLEGLDEHQAVRVLLGLAEARDGRMAS